MVRNTTTDVVMISVEDNALQVTESDICVCVCVCVCVCSRGSSSRLVSSDS